MNASIVYIICGFIQIGSGNSISQFINLFTEGKGYFFGSVRVKVRLHVPSLRIPVSVTVTVKFTLTDRIGSEPNLLIECSVTIDTMINFDSDFDGQQAHGRYM